MKFFSWMKSKIHGKDNTIKPEPQSPCHQPAGKEEGSGCLLSIGTFGDMINREIEDESKELEELRGLVYGDEGESERFDLPIEKIMESLSEEEEIIAEGLNDTPSCSSMYKKSITFLIKKAFLCGGGFEPLRHPFPDPRSRMDKAVIRKKKHPKYLEEEETNSNNWVKTDSQYIFLDL